MSDSLAGSLPPKNSCETGTACETGGQVPTEKNVANQPPQPSGFARLAKQISGRTTDLLAIALVLTAGLGFGRQVLEWWHAEPESPAPAAGQVLPAIAPGDDGAPIALEFGDAPFSMSRQTFTGDRDQAIRLLATSCRTATESANATGSVDAERTAAEQPLLDAIAGLRPFEEVQGQWRLYQVESPLLLIIGVRDVAQEKPAGEPARGNSDEKKSPAESSRVICWGTALQRSEQAWTLYTFQAAPSTVAQGPAPSDGLPPVPLPPGGRRLLALRDQSGGMLVGFAGSGPPAAWTRYYDDWFRTHGWRSAAGWQISGTNWAAGFSPAVPAGGRVDIHFSGAGKEDLTGLISVVPAGTAHGGQGPAEIGVKKRGAE